MSARPIRILGLSCYYHDAAAALVEHGRIVAAAQEERFTRVKGDPSFPHRAVGCCLDAAGIGVGDIDHIVFYENPLLKFDRLLATHALTAPFSLRSFLRAAPSWLTQKLWLGKVIAAELGVRRQVVFCDHHLSHAASAFFPSPFARAAVLTVDGVGEWSTTTWGTARDNRVILAEQLRFPNSWGLLYAAFTSYTGFKINSGEYKLMGLAPFGRPVHTELILDKLARLGADGSVVLDQRYFDYAGGRRMTNARFHALFGGKPRRPESPITQREMDIAASIQAVTNEGLLRLARHVRSRTGEEHLALAGGVALNGVAVGQISAAGIFKEIWIQPAAGDAGGALGAALWMWHQRLGHARAPEAPDAMRGACLGTDIPPVSAADDAVLRRLGAVWEEVDEAALQDRIAAAVAAGQVVAIARGRMEFGPRALGARSILGDARSAGMQSHLNLKVKFRESFRPFAPMVLAEAADSWFEMRQESPYMQFVSPVRGARRIAADPGGRAGIELLQVPRSTIPAVTHVDCSARVQTVDARRHPFMRGVLERFAAATGCPVMVNTSFNVRGEPIVNSAEDAYRCFMATGIDRLVVGSRWLERERQPRLPASEVERQDWLRRFEPD